MKTFVIGDLHGGYKALKQVIERSGFDPSNDRLISLGDIADGWPQVAECFEYLISLPNFVMVRGNHDQWLKEWMDTGDMPDIWTMQGGKNTIASYDLYPELKEKHYQFLKKTKHWFIDGKNLFVHGCYKDGVEMELQDKMFLMWGRDFYRNADLCESIKDFDRVFIGHTTIWKNYKWPLQVHKVVFMDTGGGWEGKLSMLNIDTNECFQSDLVSELYPNTRPR